MAFSLLFFFLVSIRFVLFCFFVLFLFLFFCSKIMLAKRSGLLREVTSLCYLLKMVIIVTFTLPLETQLWV